MSLNDIVPVTIKSRMLDGATRQLRPINAQLVCAAEPAVRAFGLIIGVSSDSSFDVQLSRVLSISDRVKVATRNGPVKIGDRVLSVRVINKAADSVEARSEDGERLTFIPEEHILAIVTDDELIPTSDLYLISAQPDRRMVGSIEVIGSKNLEMHSSKILACGPLTTYGEPGMYAVHAHVMGVKLDSFEVRRRFGTDLKLIREKSLHAVSTAPIDDDPTCENNPDPLPVPMPRGLQ